MIVLLLMHRRLLRFLPGFLCIPGILLSYQYLRLLYEL